MNNRNWIAVFLGLACLVLFVSVMGASNGWLNNNKGNDNMNPQQINQTISNMETTPNENTSTKLNTSQMTNNQDNTLDSKNSEKPSNALDVPQINMPNLNS